MVLAVSVDIRKSARVAAVVLAAIAGSSLITACQNDPDIDITKLTAETDPPDVLYNQGLANLNAGKTTEAARKFEAIDKQHPFSEYARKALVMNAFVAYRNGQYQDAINSTNRYLNLYPQSEDAAYAQYIQRLAYTKQIPSVTQDQRPAAKAIDKQHPFSEYARKALVMNAFVAYRNGQYQDAINSTNRYLNLYPQSEDAAYAQYIQGLAYTKQIPSVTQDQRPAAKAIEAMQVVVDKYPDSEYVDDAQAKIRFARDQLAGKEMQVGRYYLERKEYLAAISRFRTVVERYPTTNQVEEALARLVEAYYAMGVTGEAQTAAAVLGHNYPDSQWYADSYKLLQSGGLEPRETGTSWIARAGKNLIGA
ncbi:outer membrane protein assembly factor BamD [Sinorhizobium meliloti]|uniref:outer membrane protein assembly factor BamD n=1 Tax=Rhizobium meliloti TaxID=382 RepID=UPI000FD38BE6|nr:outer membrane protein assembly factor BamD [Sinorhizobium meliloti]RVN70572.1 outer membrane protein assembly factor BamD [Sinorhizobium meliloti]